jgi:hypothetical protein
MKKKLSHVVPRLIALAQGERRLRRDSEFRGVKPVNTFTRFSSVALGMTVLLQGLIFVAPMSAQISVGGEDEGGPPQATVGKTYEPAKRSIVAAKPVNFAAAAAQEALAPSFVIPGEIRAIQAPNARPDRFGRSVPIASELSYVQRGRRSPKLPLPSATGVSPAPSKTFKGEFLSGTTIPPDTMGAVGTTHILTVSNNQIRAQNRDGEEISRMTLNAFWAGVPLEGGAAASTFDPKILFDRFNERFIFISSANAQTLSSSMLVAVSQSADPTGLWNRFVVDADPAATPAGGIWIDYPSIGFNKDWIVVNENCFGYGTAGTGYQRADVYVIDKAAAYANTLTSISAFQGLFADCLASQTQELELGCGFTMVPTVVEDNTTDTLFLVEDWDATAAQLRISKVTGTSASPVLTVATQFPQSVNSWRFNAARIGPASGGYMPQRQQSAHLTSGTRIMANDSRIQNAVLRNGSLWTSHHVMVAATPSAAGVAVGGAANPDIRSAVQWWQIDPTIENNMTGTLPIQRARIEDPLANNCHDGSAGTVATPPCNGLTANQVGQFFSFPTISVNQNNDVLIGFSMMSALTYPNGGYAFRASTDPINTTRDPVVFRPGQANYNIGAGSGAARQNRWGDFSATQTDPLNDTDFWTIQEYAGAVRDFGIGLAGNWETWWALVKPNGPTPVNTTSGPIISEFRLRGPQGARDEFIEIYNPSNSPIRVTTTDNSEGWAVASNNGAATIVLALIPVGTVIPARGHFLIANNPDGITGPALVYSLNGYPSVTGTPNTVRGADSDTGYSLDVSDISGIALFNTANTASFSNLTVLDATGPNTLPGGNIFREGAGYAPLPVTNTQYTMHRTQLGGTPADTGDNATDFLLNDAASTAGVRLGAPGPENLDSPVLNNNIFVDRFNSSVASNQPNNVFRKVCAVAEECLPNRSALGTLSIRRRVTNSTGAPVTRIRFRVRDISTLPSPVGTADIRPITSTDAIDTVSGLLLRGTALEEPPTQTLAGGWNASWALGIVNLAAPLAPGASVDVQFLVGVQQGGSYRIFVVTEALP